MKLPTLAFMMAAVLGCGMIAPATAVEDARINAPFASKDSVAIAKGGKALAVITVAPQASEATKKTAAELAGLLKRITGAEFTVKEGGAPEGITLGTLAQFPDESLKEAMAIRDTYDGLEAFAIRSGGGKIRLLGNTDLGISHAAFRFLDLLGCRWFFQGPAWEVIPQVPDLSFNLNETSRPEILTRDIWFGRITQKWEKGDPDANAAFDLWARANRMGMSLKVYASHFWQALPTVFKEDGLPFKKEFDEHPEYFALVDGKRTPPQLCVANPGLQKIAVEYARKYFEKKPEAHMVSLDTADQGGWCTCPECAKLGPYPCQPFFLANLVAKDLQKTNPGKYVGLLAYSWHSDAPPFTLEPNVYVMLTAGMNASKYSFDELFKFWTKKCRHLGIYEYYSYWEMDKAMVPGVGPQDNYETIGPRLRNFATNHVDSISGQSASSWAANGLGYWLASRLMWDSTLDTKALRRDFYEKAFGPAAAPMERYFERLNLANKPLPGASLLRECLGDLEEATPLAANRPDVLARITALKESLVYSAIGLKVTVANDDAEVKKHTLDWFTWSYRTRNNYMNDWITFRSAVGRPAAEKLGEKTWFWRNTGDSPWKTNAPVTPQELEARLRDVKAELGELPTTPEAKFSDRYVLVKTGQSGGGASKLLFSGRGTYLLASVKGESLRLTLTKRDTGWIEKPDARYTLTAQDGTEVAKGGVPTGRHEVELKVPGPGIYRFSCLRGGTGWEIELPAETPHALIFTRGEKCTPGAITSSWFYVPKGTPAVVMYTHTQSGQVVRAPDNRVVYKEPSVGRYVSIPVKPGDDGKLWTMAGRPSHLWFFNVPTVLSFNAQWAFVPEEVAKKDGLQVLQP